ncbi:MAG: Spy/CpxP family protein refolding chaperone, partial [Gammaproteobacteria bacterium]
MHIPLTKVPRRGSLPITLLCVLAAGAPFGQAAASDADGGETRECARHYRHEDGISRDPVMRFAEELGLTGQQQSDIRIIASDYAERFRDLAKLGRETAEDLLSLAPDNPAYRAKTDEASALAATSAAEMIVLLAEMRAKFYAVLTDEQRRTLQRKLDEKTRQVEENKRQRRQDG